MLTLQRGAALAAFAAILAGALVGCNKPGSDTSSGGGAISGGDIASVNNESISQSDFFTELQAYRPNPNQPAQPAGRAVLQQLIMNSLVAQLAKKEGVYPSDVQIDDQFKNYQMLQEAASVKSFSEQLADVGLSPQQMKTMNIVPQLCQVNLMTKGIDVSDADIKSYYDQHKGDQFTTPARAHIKRLVVGTQSDANDIAAKIKAGSTFEEQFQKSIDKTDPTGDVSQWIPVETADPRLAPLVDQIKKTDKGKVSEPFQFNGTWWLIEVVDKQPKQTWPLENVKSMIKIETQQRKIQTNPARMTQFAQDLRAAEQTAKITINGPQYQSLITQIQNPPPVSPMGAPGAGAPAGAPSVSAPPSAPKKP